MRKSSALVAASVLVAVLAGCGGEVAEKPSSEATAVVGTSDCSFLQTSFEALSEGAVIGEHFTCTLEMSDARVSGVEEFDVVTTFDPAEPAALWTSDTDSITNDGGIWRGTGAFGVVDFRGVSPFAEGVFPFNYGEQHFVGEGEYAGLSFTYYVAGSNTTGAIAGWIEETG